MPAEQQQIATAMRDRLAAIDAARKQYAEAADASAADADINIKRMNEDLQALQTNIETRKKQLAAANTPELRKAAEDERQAQLTKKTAEVATDTWITSRIKTKVVDEDTLKGSDVHVTTKDHVVTLTGYAKSDAGRLRAGEIARSVEGVKEIVNKISVK
jgi:hyperosmotically inducible protein